MHLNTAAALAEDPARRTSTADEAMHSAPASTAPIQGRCAVPSTRTSVVDRTK